MQFKLEISADNVTFQKVDLFPEQQLEYDLDFYDSLDIGKVKLPFYTNLRIPLTVLNQSVDRFNFNPLTSDASTFPKQDYYFKITIFGSSSTVIIGVLNVKSFEYNSSQSFMEVELKDYLSKYLSTIKDKALGTIYSAPYYQNRQTMSSFLTNELGTLDTLPDYTRPISFPYIDFCNDVDGKFGYAARQFLEYGPSMTRGGIAPVFSVPKFFETLATYISSQSGGFPLRADSKLFEIGAYSTGTGITGFNPEQLHFATPARLLAKADTNTRNFFLRQSPAWAGTNESLESCTDLNNQPKLIHCDYFGNIETCGNYGSDGENQPLYDLAEWGAEKLMDFYPYDDTSGFDQDGIRGFFAPKVSFNAALSFNSGNASATLEGLKFEIPIVQEDKMVLDIQEDDQASTMRWKLYVGVYRDGEDVKKIALQDFQGNDLLLSTSDIETTSQGFSNKTSHSSGASYDFHICPKEDGNHEGALLDNLYANQYRDTINFLPVTAYLPTGEEIMIDSGSQYSVNYFLEPFDGELILSVVTGYVPHSNHYDSDTYSFFVPFSPVDFRKAITRIESYGQLNIKFSANESVLPYRFSDEVSIQDSINESCTLTVYEVLTAVLKRFECGLFYEYDSVNSTDVLRIDPLSLARFGGQDINQFLDDLKSVKISNGGDKIKTLEINNKSYNSYFDDLNNDGITIGSTVQEINPEGIAELKIDLKSSVYYKSVCGEEIDNETFNSNFGAFSARQLGFTANLFTANKDVGLRFAYLDKPLYKTNILTPMVTLAGLQEDDKMRTESQIVYGNQSLAIADIINGQYALNGRLSNYNTAGWNLLFEDEEGDVQDAYTDIFAVSEKILQSEQPRIEFNLVVPTAELASLDFFLQTFSATNFTPSQILVKSASGDVYDDFAYLTIEGILQ